MTDLRNNKMSVVTGSPEAMREIRDILGRAIFDATSTQFISDHSLRDEVAAIHAKFAQDIVR